jgi:hypothetical protein
MNASGVSLKTKGLRDLKKRMGAFAKASVDVGIFSTHNARDDGTTNAEVGYKMEFGSHAASTPSTEQIEARGREDAVGPVWQGNPARSFLLMPIVTELPSLLAKENKALSEDVVTESPKLVLEKIGFLAEAAIQDAFDTGGFGTWPPNSEKTIDWKGSDKPLIDSEQLRHSISSRVN